MRIHGIKTNADGTHTPFCDYCDWKSADFKELESAKSIYRIHLANRRHAVNAKKTRIVGWGRSFRKK